MLYLLDFVWMQAKVRLPSLQLNWDSYTILNVPDAIYNSYIPQLLRRPIEQLEGVCSVILYLLFILNLLAACAEQVVGLRKLGGDVPGLPAINLLSLRHYYAANIHSLDDFDNPVRMDSNDCFLAHFAG